MKKKDSIVVGDTFGRLVATGEPIPVPSTRGPMWHVDVQCSCGRAKRVRLYSLLAGHTKSCGCLQRDVMSTVATTHGHSLPRTSTYIRWASMIQRCTNQHHARYRDWGGRGIIVCPAWISSYSTFLADMGQCPPEQSLDRIDNNGPYCPFNTRWATPDEQSHNRRNTKWIEHDGQRHTLRGWARITGLRRGTIACRLHRGWTIRRALTTPAYSQDWRETERKLKEARDGQA